MDEATRMAAAEYVLGTLPAEEREHFAERMVREPNLAAAVAAMETRLAPLAASLPEEAPPPELWRKLAASLDEGGASAIPAAPASPSSGKGPAGGAQGAEIVSLRRRLAIWRGSALATGALAAGLALAVILRPDFFVPPPTQGEETDRYVAVVDAEGRQPAMVVTVDTAAGTVSVRSLSAQVPDDHSLELWYVGGGGAPRSIGVLEEREEAKTLRVGASELATIADAAIAVSVEPPGGSPTGTATGPVIYQGKLVPEPR
ncbi:anti-sigma factor [Afifella pfennigii]|uniref:anti-sigma factor n=1 Tax=Afifella pfennigii TaxID=209897 RepID=UPI00047BB26C|nr:anti-sigma factor [Afifella pfennigii]